MDCDRPLRAVCRDCDAVEFWRCDSYGCTECGEAKRRRLEKLVHSGAALQIGKGLYGYFLTVTAPGTRSHKVWVQGKQPGARRDCSCHEHGMRPGEWNATESANWNRLRTNLSRDSRVEFMGSVETQKRGLLHRHIVLFSPDRLSFSEVQEHARAAGYGCVMDLEPLQDVSKAAKYLSKYVTKSSGERGKVPWAPRTVDPATGQILSGPAPATFRTWSSSRQWGVTMKGLKAVMAAQARQRAMYLRDLQQLLAEDAGGQHDSPEGQGSPSLDPP